MNNLLSNYNNFIYIFILCTNLGNDSFHVKEESQRKLETINYAYCDYYVVDEFTNHPDLEVRRRINRLKIALVDNYVFNRYGKYPWIHEDIIYNRKEYINGECCTTKEYPGYRAAMRKAIQDLTRKESIISLIDIIDKCKEKEEIWKREYKKVGYGKIIID